jgi:hypothetical protein
VRRGAILWALHCATAIVLGQGLAMLMEPARTKPIERPRGAR